MIVAIDPGKMVGYAVRADSIGFHASQSDKWEFLTWADPVGWDEWFDVVIIERYIITPKTAKLSQQHDALDVLGVIRWWCHKADVPLLEYSAAEAKSFSTDAKLKAASMWTPGQDHACDAARHLMLYMVREKIMDLSVLR
jgi:hypothetical protein